MTLENEDKAQYTWRRSVEQAHERLVARGLKRFPEPVHAYDDLGEIENITELGDIKLADMAMRLNSWYSYSTVELAYKKAAYASLEEIYEVLVGEAMYQGSLTNNLRVVKDVLRSMSIQNSDTLRYWHRQKIDLMQDVQLLEGTVKGLEIRCRAVESEQIRRASQRRVEVAR